ncbi:hypothetical protein OIDMADRAFT_61441 [Oidiodendron maius Zn]|uniref:Uncharacterized protein n=1 Tax=Oidiodendron maius (strain Zn) TaxID=913774 RepID=A0A0C3CUV7_OIDMZ|nr:hypothetical protein OIDMADRAFT_61441 [Oidiodendron maius Zn]
MLATLGHLTLALVLYALYTAGSVAANLVETKALVRRQSYDDCWVAQCGQACFVPFTATYCQVEPNGQDLAWIVIGDTAGFITSFNSTQVDALPPIMSLLLVITGGNQTNDCPYIQFSFYDANDSITGFTYITPGQIHSPCITFDGQVTAYSGITMLATVPEELLELANNHGNVMDEGYNSLRYL